jgi:hypothetical protein
VKNLFDANIIVSLRFSKWSANLVPVRKKNGEKMLCRFQGFEQGVFEGQLSSPKDGLHFTKSCGIRKKNVNVI